MSIVAAELIAEITVKGAEAAIGQIEGLGGVVGSVGGVLATFGVAAAGALIGVGAESVKMAGDFQQSLTQLVTGAGESQKNLQMVSDGILNIAVATGTSTKQLTEGMYQIESAGFHGAQGLDVLKAAAEGAKAGNAQLGTVAQAVTTVMTDYAKAHLNATQATNALIATEQVGKTHLEDLSRAMGTVLPLASAAGLSFEQVAGGMAVMTNAGMTAQRAAQTLAFAIRNLEAPSSIAVTAMTTVGLKAQDLKDTLAEKGLSGALQMIEEHVGAKFPAGSVNSVEAFKAILGGAVGYNAALMLGGEHMKAYEANIKSIGDALHKGGADVEGFAQVQQNFNFKLDQAKEAVNVLMIKLGTALLPVLNDLLTKITPLITQFSDWITKSDTLNKVATTLKDTLNEIPGIIDKINTAVKSAINFWKDWGPTITAVSVALTIYFIPAIVKSGVESVAAGARIAISFVANLVATGQEGWTAAAKLALFIASTVQSGTQAVIAGAKVAASFVVSLVQSGTEAALAGAKITVAFVASVIKTGAEAFVAGVKIAASFVASLILAGVQAVATGAKIMASFVASLIQTGAQAIIAGAQIAASFVASLIEAAAQAAFTGATMMASLVPALISVIIEATIAAVSAIPALVIGFLAWAAAAAVAAAATIAATWPVLVIIAALALLGIALYLLVTHWKEVTSTIQSVWQGFTSWVSGSLAGLSSTFHTAIGSIGAALSTIPGIASTAMGGLVSAFNWGLGQVRGVVAGIGGALSSLSGLAGQAFSWGANIIGGFVNGIRSQIGAAGQAAADVAQNVAGALGIHDVHLPGFASGTSFAPGGLAIVGERGPEVMYVPRGAQVTPVSNPQLRAATQSQPTIIVQPAPIYLDGRLLANGLMPHITSAIRYGTGVR